MKTAMKSETKKVSSAMKPEEVFFLVKDIPQWMMAPHLYADADVEAQRKRFGELGGDRAALKKMAAEDPVIQMLPYFVANPPSVIAERPQDVEKNIKLLNHELGKQERKLVRAEKIVLPGGLTYGGIYGKGLRMVGCSGNVKNMAKGARCKMLKKKIVNLNLFLSAERFKLKVVNDKPAYIFRALQTMLGKHRVKTAMSAMKAIPAKNAIPAKKAMRAKAAIAAKNAMRAKNAIPAKKAMRAKNAIPAKKAMRAKNAMRAK
jgi:hypothetical protein